MGALAMSNKNWQLPKQDFKGYMSSHTKTVIENSEMVTNKYRNVVD